MHEQFTEKTRRAIFFARYEAVHWGASHIEPEHLVLGVLREDRPLANRLLLNSPMIESIRQRLEEHVPVKQDFYTSVEVPYSPETERAIEFAIEEAGVGAVTTAHLFLGLLRLQDHFILDLLQEQGVSLATARERLLTTLQDSHALRRSRTTACRDCKHLMVIGPLADRNLFCAASPTQPQFDCYTGEFQSETSAQPSKQFRNCRFVNFGNCELFDAKEG